MRHLGPIFGMTLALYAMRPAPADAQLCPGAPFLCAVDEAVQRGLQALRDAEGGAGAVVEGDAAYNAYAVLAFLNAPGNGFSGRALGFEGLGDADRARVIRLLRAAIDADPALTLGDGLRVSVTGRNLEVLSRFLASGGPDDIGAPVTVIEAIVNGVAALHAHQGDALPDNPGGWSEGVPEAVGDLAATLPACRGLAAASSIIEGADVPLVQRTPAFLRVGQRDNDDGGSGRRPGQPSNSAMTAAALLCYRLTQVPAGDPGPQRSLGWLHAHWTFDRVIGEAGDAQASAFFYLWAVTEALWISDDDGLGGAIYADAFGARDPAAEGFAGEWPDAFFDVAITLLGWQDPQSGLWGGGYGGSPVGPTPMASHTFALLTLERSRGAYDIDADNDGLLGVDDNCPDLANPDQADADEDGIGDACDRCVDVPDPEQADSDMDGIGDACDPLDCAPDGLSEICDGIDNDCDGLIDEGADLCPADERCVDGGCVSICPGPDCPPESGDAGSGDAEISDAGISDAGISDAEVDADADVADAGEVMRDTGRSAGGCGCDVDGEGPPTTGWLLLWAVLGLGRRQPASRRRLAVRCPVDPPTGEPGAPAHPQPRRL